MKFKGKVHKYGDNIDTDAIIPARYLNISNSEELARHCLEGLDGEFVKKMRPGDMIVAGANFGCGSSREHAPMAIKAAGVSCVIAESFARIFFRNALNIGLPVLECPQAVKETESGDLLEVELSTGEVHNLTRHKAFQAKPYPEFMQELISAGGLVEYTKKRIETRG